MGVLIQVDRIHKSYGARVILDAATVSLSEGQKIGMIGRNGAGKSTLCKIIIGQEEADGGEIVKNSQLRLSYLEQHDPYSLDETVMDFLKRYTGKEEWQCGKVAGRFQLKNELLDTKIGELSGGYRTRVKLTSMLLAEPNFLILDEPTNYLDLKTLILLENFLVDWDGAFLVVSHDREFLKRTCEMTLEVENGDLTLYPGNVEEYFEFKEEQVRLAESINRTVEAKQKQLQAFVERFRAKASKASQAKSKLKQMQRLKTIEIAHPMSNVHIRIPQVDKRNAVAITCDHLSIGYPEKTVASRIDMEINQGQHVAVLGDNGQGKTTFLRTIAGDLPGKGGKFKWGFNLKIAYYAQHVFTSLHPEHDVFTHLQSVAAPDIGRQEILNLAGSFLFKGDDVKKKVKVLSGGERARLLLAGLLLTKSPVLLLDEPTNHLDFETVEALANALKKFHGTIFFISHDRTFVNLIANEIVEVQGGSVRRYPGTYEDYVYSLEVRAREEDGGAAPAKSGGDKSAKSEYELRKEQESEKRKIEGGMRRAEQSIAAYKKERDEIHELFVADAANWSRDRHQRYEELERLIREAEKLWVELGEKLEALPK
jgi:ATP-binding cassette subfamily F protein 3